MNGVIGGTATYGGSKAFTCIPTTADRGFSKKLYQHIETLAQEDTNVRGLRLYVEEENAAGQAVYKKLGMSHAGYHVYEREF